MDAASAGLVFLLSVAPISELRGGIPYALAAGASPAEAFALGVAGNLVVVPILLWGFERAEKAMRRIRFVGRVLDRLLVRVRRTSRWIERYGPAALVFLVAVPLPGTGAWTAAIAATLLGIRPARAIAPIGIGVVIAGILVLLGSLGVIRILGVG